MKSDFDGTNLRCFHRKAPKKSVWICVSDWTVRIRMKENVAAANSNKRRERGREKEGGLNSKRERKWWLLRENEEERNKQTNKKKKKRRLMKSSGAETTKQHHQQQTTAALSVSLFFSFTTPSSLCYLLWPWRCTLSHTHTLHLFSLFFIYLLWLFVLCFSFDGFFFLPFSSAPRVWSRLPTVFPLPFPLCHSFSLLHLCFFFILCSVKLYF